MRKLYADDLINEGRSGSRVEAGLPDGRWVAARPVRLWGLRATLGRIRQAWDVARGRADALYWHGQ